ncbi:MAG TPA: vitamin K epoxide reductase family protein [Pyrinomonadaceae bacterium]|nr:vitamin K epoxide reductase family protein [Pyrinomonadaceae bacterium]
MTPSENSPKKFAWLYLIAAILSLGGLADAIYLTVQDLTGASLRCTIISGCSEVLASKYSHIGSIPLASVGAVAYFVFFSLAILAAFGYAFIRPLLTVLVTLMFLTSLWLIHLQAFVIHHFCQYCLLSAAITTIITVLVFSSHLGRTRST